MTTRDRMPYADHAGQLADGTALFTLYNLTAKDVELIRELLSERRRRNRVQLTELDAPPHTRAELALEAERMDQLSTVLAYIAA